MNGSTLYKDLATKTFKLIFKDSQFLLNHNLGDAQALILKHSRLLSNNIEKTLFVFELRDLMKHERIFTDFRKISKFNIIANTDSKFIDELCSWLEAKESWDVKKKDDTKYWLREVSSLKKLADFLVQADLIDKDQKEDFVNLFLQSNGSTVTWLGTSTLLVYLFELLGRDNIIDKSGLTNKFIEENFIDKNSKTFVANVKQIKVTIKNKAPRNCATVDSIITSLKNALP